ncbi:hypothetical protein SEEGA711_22295 [Salmonella enterica subsp. enterica serovar Gaminara str. ATCC BAA-711]|nr:hypothetical protein SEEGA711_22295 [Salmonella enterica subsp. enterica serovar Gaminara str. ATCC BAA-711]
MRYFFMAEPIRAMEGDLLGVEITTHFASSPARPLHPEFVISSWDNSQKRRFLLDLLRTIAAKHGWFLRHGLFCIVNIDRGMGAACPSGQRYSRITTRHAICGAAGR